MSPRDDAYLAALARAHLLAPDAAETDGSEEDCLSQALEDACDRLGLDIADVQLVESNRLRAEGLLDDDASPDDASATTDDDASLDGLTACDHEGPCRAGDEERCPECQECPEHTETAGPSADESPADTTPPPAPVAPTTADLERLGALCTRAAHAGDTHGAAR